MNLLRRLSRKVKSLRTGETAATMFDLGDPEQVNAVFRQAGLTAGASRFSPAATNRVHHLWDNRPDLRDAFPLGLTPHPDRARLLNWLLTEGTQPEHGLTADESLAFLHEHDATPDRGLLATYSMRPDWQAAVPHGATWFGFPRLVDYVESTYGLTGRWHRRARWRPMMRPVDELAQLPWPRPSTLTVPTIWRRQYAEDCAGGRPGQPGVNVIGHFKYVSGLQEAALGVAEAIRRAGGRVALRNLPHPQERDDLPDQYRDLELFDTTVFVAGINTEIDPWYHRAGLFRRPGVRRIAMWYWEVSDLPDAWRPKLQWPDEVWAPTQFAAECFRKYVSCPVATMLPGLVLPDFEPLPRSHFGLPEKVYLFLFNFDMASVVQRKNPFGLIRAFRKAFAPNDRVHLGIKVTRGSFHPEAMSELHSAAREHNITIIDRTLPRADALALLNCADAYVSLHRSEGLGLGLAESMALGKPVIGTDYSGNRDFMTPETSYPVRYTLAPIPAGADPYPAGSLWAEPDLDHAVELMRRVVARRDEAREIGERAREHIRRVMSVELFGQRMLQRVARLNGVRNAA